MLRRVVGLALLGLFAFLTTGVNAASAGCGKPAGLTSGVKTINVNGRSRQYTLQLPNNYNSTRPYRVVYGFHWYGASMNEVVTGSTVPPANSWRYYGLQRLANDSTIFVAPNGLNNGWYNNNNEDLAFVDAMVSALAGGLCVDEKQLFAIGFSFGGAMSKLLGCQRAKVFRGVVILDGGGPTNGLNTCSADPIGAMVVHGMSDGIEGGRSSRDIFVKKNGCPSQTAREPAVGSRTHIKTEYTGCKAGYPVWYIAFDGGHQSTPYDGGTGDNGDKSFSPPEAWKFFSQFK